MIEWESTKDSNRNTRLTRGSKRIYILRECKVSFIFKVLTKARDLHEMRTEITYIKPQPSLCTVTSTSSRRVRSFQNRKGMKIEWKCRRDEYREMYVCCLFLTETDSFPKEQVSSLQDNEQHKHVLYSKRELLFQARKVLIRWKVKAVETCLEQAAWVSCYTI